MRVGAGRDYRSQHAAAGLPPPTPYLAGRRQGCCNRSIADSQGACPTGAGGSVPGALLQMKPWERCWSTPCCADRTGKGQGRPAASLEQLILQKRGGSGEGRSLLEGPGAVSVGLSEGKVMPGRWQGPGRW